MSESAASQCVDQFSCPVCLDPLKEPVTIPCGHSYCMSCITDCWGQKEQGPPYRCPQCRESFSQRPLLKKNTLIAEMMETLQKTSLQTAAVECDVCTTEKNRAVKSCLQCLASFCQTHLQLHYQSPAFMKHKLVQASRDIQENICLSHGKLLEFYCQDDRQCICYLCMIDNHNGHRVVSLESEWTNQKKELKEIKVSCQKLIQERERGKRELSAAVKLLKSSALESMEDIEKVFTELICSLEKKRSEIKEQIRAQEKTEIDRAEELHKHLDQELTELRKRQAEIDKLLITDDQLHGLKNYYSHFRAVSLCVFYLHLKTFPASLNTLICLLKTFQSQSLRRFWRTSVNSKQPEYLEKCQMFMLHRLQNQRLQIHFGNISVNCNWIQTRHTKSSSCQKRTEKHHIQLKSSSILITQSDLIGIFISCVERVCAVAVTGRSSAVGTTGL
ncbi:E3 ubiquitin/ISG15 ligase TRIM25-like isoform X2 [Rhinichthys klamathensis goyatoka]|uniref:E3 ubiquitin/ISG15 ligase TRIM25-like isoform X2 n=1 Tax=Rhinichthys klamathensis goyatoka TaxID=3034132 RepID=UPI0024B5C4D5|nr:E3 ubiquitin/ISG15 ligase TRIM25-like isoform X2 [Rhinichthys klamathensis goyatoka]